MLRRRYMLRPVAHCERAAVVVLGMTLKAGERAVFSGLFFFRS